MSEQPTVSTSNTDNTVTTTTNVEPSATTSTTTTHVEPATTTAATTTTTADNSTTTTTTTTATTTDTEAAVAPSSSTTTTTETPAATTTTTAVPASTSTTTNTKVEQKHHVDASGQVVEPIPMPNTIVDALEHTIQRFPHHLAIRVKRNGVWRQWSWMQYRQDIYATAKAFVKMGLKVGGGVNIIGFNSPEWHLCQLGCIWAGGLPTGVYTTSAPSQCEFFANHSEAQFICVENQHQLDKYMEIRHNLPNVKAFILMEPFDVRSKHAPAPAPATATTTTSTAPATAHHGPVPSGEIPIATTTESQPNGSTTTTNTTGVTTTTVTSTSTTTTTTTTAEAIPAPAPVPVAATTSTATPNGSEGLPPGVFYWEDFLEQGRSVPDSEIDRLSKAITPDTLCTLIYTSGTTGVPKGCMITQRNAAWTCHTVGSIVLHPLTGHRERFISYLPLSHVAEQVVTLYAPLVFGFSVSFADRNALQGTLLDTLLEIKPTIFFGVPRVWEKIQLKIQTTLNQKGGIQKKLVNWAKSKGIEGGYKQQRGEKKPKGYGLARTLVFKKLLKQLGLDQCRFFASTAAPISKDTLEFFLSLGITVTEAYGMSELTGPQCVSYPRAKTGSVGKTMPGSEIKLNPGDDEICVKGPNCFIGYYKNPEATRETIDEDGWVHTGDIGKIDENGYLFITDRKKELIITAGGENISPSLIEGYLRQIPGVNHAVVVGDRQKYLVCLLTINIDYLPKINFSPTTVEEAVRDKVFNDYLQAKIDDMNARLPNVSTIKKYRICPHDFADSGTDSELTPTQKLKRKIILAKYDALIRDMYGDQYAEGSFNQPPPVMQNSIAVMNHEVIPPVEQKVEPVPAPAAVEQPPKKEEPAPAPAPAPEPAVVPVVVPVTVTEEKVVVVEPAPVQPAEEPATTTTTVVADPVPVVITETVVVEEVKKEEEEKKEEVKKDDDQPTVIHETVPVTIVEPVSQDSEKTVDPKVETAAQSDITTTVNIVTVEQEQTLIAGEVVAAAQIIKVVEPEPEPSTPSTTVQVNKDQPQQLPDNNENGKKDDSSDDDDDSTSSDTTTSSDDDSSSSDYSTSTSDDDTSSEETDSEEYSESSDENKKVNNNDEQTKK